MKTKTFKMSFMSGPYEHKYSIAFIWNGIKFVVHRPVELKKKSRDVIVITKWWEVSHFETGRKINVRHNTVDLTIEYAKERLDKIGLEKVLDGINKCK